MTPQGDQSDGWNSVASDSAKTPAHSFGVRLLMRCNLASIKSRAPSTYKAHLKCNQPSYQTFLCSTVIHDLEVKL